MSEASEYNEELEHKHAALKLKLIITTQELRELRKQHDHILSMAEHLVEVAENSLLRESKLRDAIKRVYEVPRFDAKFERSELEGLLMYERGELVSWPDVHAAIAPVLCHDCGKVHTPTVETDPPEKSL